MILRLAGCKRVRHKMNNMFNTPYRYQIFLKLILLILVSNALQGQKIIRDTTTFTQYDVYCESILVCEYLVPDSTYERLKGRLLYHEAEEDWKYQKYCYYLGYDSDYQLYSFKDFVLTLADKKLEFSYPQYSFALNKYFVFENLKKLKLYSHKTNKTINVKTLYLSFDSEAMQRLSLPEDSMKLDAAIESKISDCKKLRLKLEPLEYPFHKEDCGRILVHFPTLEVYLH